MLRFCARLVPFSATCENGGTGKNATISRRVVAGEPGFEPRQTESESVVLPLHHSPIITQTHQWFKWMSGQSAGAGSCKSPLSLVRRSTRSVRALASAEEAAFSGEGSAWGRRRLRAGPPSGRRRVRPHSSGKFGCCDPGLRQNLLQNDEPDAGGKPPIKRHARRLIFARCAPRLLPLVGRACRHDRRNLPMPIGHAMLIA
jgi:hypothetical protein